MSIFGYYSGPLLLNKLDHRHKDFVYVNFMRSGNVQRTRKEEVRGIDTRACYQWKSMFG